MTAPYDPKIVPVPGTGQELSQSLAPFINAMQFQKHLQVQQQEEEQRVAAELYARGLQTTPGFEETPAAVALEQKLGAPGLGAGIAKARVTTQRRQIEDINSYVEGLSGLSDQIKTGLRASLIAGTKGATSDIQNQLFNAMAGGADLSALEQARLDNLKANTIHILAEIDKMRREPTPQDNKRAAQIMGIDVNGSQYAGDNFPYVNVLEDRLKQPEADPRRQILNVMISLMTSNKDLLGRPALQPAEAFQLGLNAVSNLYPTTAATMQLTPQYEQTLAATKAATVMWQGLRMDEMTLKDAQGRVLRKFKTNKDIHDYIQVELKHLYPLIDEPSMNTLMDIVQRRVTESF